MTCESGYNHVPFAIAEFVMRKSTCSWCFINTLLVLSSVSVNSQTYGVGLAQDSTWEVTIGTVCGSDHTAIGTYVDTGRQNAFSNIYVKYNANQTPQKFLYLQVTTATVPPTMMWYISSAPLPNSNSITGTYDIRFPVSGTDRTVTSIANSTAFVKCNVMTGTGIEPFTPIAVTLVLVTDCKCDRNYELLSNRMCRMCDDTRYKTTISNSSCLNCPRDKVFTDINTCICLPGSSGVTGETCVPCMAGSYNADGGTVACATCPLNSTSPSNSNTITNCTCNRGYSGPHGGPCTVCAEGKYTNTQGSESCTDCPEGKFSNVTGAMTFNDCRNCTSDSSSPAGSSNQSACECYSGYYGVRGENCLKCGIDTRLTRNDTTCTAPMM